MVGFDVQGPSQAASFLYFKDDAKFASEKPYYYNGPISEGQEGSRTNFDYQLISNVLVQDVRGQKAKLKLEEHGLEILDFPATTNLSASWNTLPVTDYLEEVTRFVQNWMSATKVLAYNYKLRKSDSQMDAGGAEGELIDGAASSPHIDQTKEGGMRRARHHMTSQEADEYLNEQHRIRILNIWRPLYHTVTDAPLAFCDRTSVSEDDLVAVDRVIPEYAGEVYYLKHSASHRWIWMSNQTTDEVFCFVSFDSAAKGDCFWGCPHASFNMDSGRSETPRQSIEVRLVVID